MLRFFVLFLFVCGVSRADRLYDIYAGKSQRELQWDYNEKMILEKNQGNKLYTMNLIKKGSIFCADKETIAKAQKFKSNAAKLRQLGCNIVTSQTKGYVSDADKNFRFLYFKQQGKEIIEFGWFERKSIINYQDIK